MALAPGTRLGPYEITGAIGAGGMGEVYRARDTKLGRDVALKILPEAFAADPERMARFEREAKVLASLNHPNIATIHGLEESNGLRALVMELVEGPTLADRIATGPTPLEEVLPIARQICEGLEYAHERGIVHRDLKPANIKITPEGTVKLLDFGLAKALEGEAATGDPSTSPTLSHLATQAGVILGTAAYMSPEQAKGKAVDRRADIWAFGCVLYEMLTGKKPFDGETITDILAAVVRAEPEWSQLPAGTPPSVRNLLARCLKKDQKQRLRDIGEARIALEEFLSGAAPEETVAGVPARPAPREIVAWALLAVLVLTGAIFGAWEWLAPRAKTPPVVVSQIPPPPQAHFVLAGQQPLPPTLSPDGKRLAFVGVGAESKHVLWVESLSTATAHPLAGTEGASYPFWSPDSRFIGFFANGKLNRIDASGGPPLPIADAPTGRGGTWSQDDTILFAPTPSASIYRVPASGGTPQPATKLDASRKEVSQRWPQFLPDGKHFLFYAQVVGKERGGTYVASLDGGPPRLLVPGDSNAVYAPPGYLLFVRQGTLMSEEFDADSLRRIGEAMPLAAHVNVSRIFYQGIFTVSGNGLLVYQPGNDVTRSGRLFWFDRNGKQIGETGTTGEEYEPSLSPDGRKLAVEKGSPDVSTSNVWVYDLARGIRTRLTFSKALDGAPSWSPDGKTIVFMSNRNGKVDLYKKSADGTGKTSPLAVDDDREIFPAFSPDGRHLIFVLRAAQTGFAHPEIWSMPLFGDRKAFPVLQGQQFGADQPALSPDGKWLAYESRDSGRPEIYVVPFGRGSGKWEVSSGGGQYPRWRRDGKELFYLSLDDRVMSVQVSEQGASLAIGKVVSLFQANPTNTFGWPYDVSADGKKFVVSTQGELKTTEPLTLVTNWPALLKKQ